MLMEIGEQLANIVDITATVLQLEVTIYSDDLVVVATSLQSERDQERHTRVGEKIRGYVVSYILRQGELTIINNPGLHEVCKPCNLWGNCPEQAIIGTPIKVNDHAVGVICIDAYTPEQREHLNNNTPMLTTYLEKLCDLIRAKVREKALANKVQSLLKRQEVIVNTIEEGLVNVDDKGRILDVNRKAELMLGAKRQSLLNQAIRDVFPELKGRFNEGLIFTNRQLGSRCGGKEVQLMVTARAYGSDDGVEGSVMVIKTMSDVHDLVQQVSLPDTASLDDAIKTKNVRLREVVTKAKLVSQSSSTILIQGESGTGKELLARGIHYESPRRRGPFIAVNCAALPENLLESELFGYESGAFTGASKKGKMGKFELAENGTIFLDEIGDMPLHLQVKLLRILEDFKIEKLGGTSYILSNVRVIVATNQNLEEMIASGEFRDDLYHRINVIPLTIPPLRERMEDIDLLCIHFLQKYTHLFNKEHIRAFSREARGILHRHRWPGNVRELQNVVEYAVNVEEGAEVQPASLPGRILDSLQVPGQSGDEEIQNLKEMEVSLINKALIRFGTDFAGKRNAAEALGIDLSTLYRKLNKYKTLEQL